MNRALHACAARAISALFVVVPNVALACPVCFSAQNEENRAAFVAMTAFLTLLPLGMLGLGLGWAWRRMQRLDQRPTATAEDAEAPTPGAHTAQ